MSVFAHHAFDLSVLSHFLKGNPVIDWLERYGVPPGIRCPADGVVEDDSGAEEEDPSIVHHVEPARTRFARLLSYAATFELPQDAEQHLGQTAVAIRGGAAVILNPALSAHHVVVRPVALVRRDVWFRHVDAQHHHDRNDTTYAREQFERNDGMTVEVRPPEEEGDEDESIVEKEEGEGGETGIARGCNSGHPPRTTTDDENTYVVVQLVTGHADTWRSRASRPLVLATCYLSQLAIADARTAPLATRLIGAILGRTPDRDATIANRIGERTRIMRECHDACAWTHAMRTDGRTWSPLCPERWEMTPNLQALYASKWESTLRHLAARVHDMTQLYYCGQRLKQRAFARGMRTVHDLLRYHELTALQKRIVWINHPYHHAHAPIQPTQLQRHQPTAAILHTLQRQPWCATDFETIQTSKRQWIFMIASTFHSPADNRTIEHHLTLRNLTDEEQHRLIHEWLHWMAAQAHAHGGYSLHDIPILHWSRAEPRFLVTLRRQRPASWFSPSIVHMCEHLQWVDVLDMFHREEIVVRGAFDYKLKSIAKALHRLGRIQTSWEDAVQNGYDAMQQARQVYVGRRTRRQHVQALDAIRRYNQIDTQVLVEITQCLMTLLPPMRSTRCA